MQLVAHPSNQTSVLHPGDYCQAIIEAGKWTTAQQAVLWMIARHVDRQTGETIVGLDTIARKCKVCYDTVARAVTALVAAGVFTRSPRVNGRSQLIRFPLHPAVTGAELSPTVRASADPPSRRPSALARQTLRAGAADPPRPAATIPYEPRLTRGRARAKAVDNSPSVVSDPTGSCAHCEGDGWVTRHEGERRWAERCTQCNAACWPVAR